MNKTIENHQDKREELTLEETIVKETVNSLFVSLPSSVAATIVIAIFMISVLWQVIDTTILLIWFSYVAVISVTRFILYKSYITKSIHTRDYIFWDKVHYILVLLNGLGFSCVSIWLLPDADSVYHYFPEMVLIGMSAGAVSSLSFRMKNIVSYFILLLAPFFIVEILLDTFISYSVAMLTVLLVAFSLGNARRFNKTVVENITLHYKSEIHYQELVKSRNIAVEANSTKTNFISMISHELRTPLNGILGFCQLLKMSDSPKLNEEQAEQTQGIMDSGKHLLRLIEDLLELPKIESARFNVTLKNVSLSDALTESITILEPIASELHSEIINKVDHDYLVKADYMRLKQIFINLISNAIKFNHEHGKIKISANKISDGHIRVSVSDDGYGLTAKQQTELFQAFKRFNEKKEGLGLGLFISKKLVKVMGGKIGVESKVKEGSTFWFDLMLAK